MSAYSDRIWLKLYMSGSPTDLKVEFDSAPAMSLDAARRLPEALVKTYSGGAPIPPSTVQA